MKLAFPLTDVDRDRWARLANELAAAIAVSLPWSTVGDRHLGSCSGCIAPIPDAGSAAASAANCRPRRAACLVSLVAARRRWNGVGGRDVA